MSPPCPPCWVGYCPCLVVYELQENTNLAACWASVGFNTAGCAMVEDSLRKCMDTKQTKDKSTNSINYHLGRFHKRLEGGPAGRKYKGSKD